MKALHHLNEKTLHYYIASRDNILLHSIKGFVFEGGSEFAVRQRYFQLEVGPRQTGNYALGDDSANLEGHGLVDDLVCGNGCLSRTSR